MKIAFLTRGRERSGSSRIRVLQYLKYLDRLKIETRVLPRPLKTGTLAHWNYLARALRLASWADIVVLQKPNHSKKLVDILARFNHRLIVDIDDAVWCPPLTRSGSSAKKLSEKFRERFLHAVQRSRFVISGSEYLANFVREACPESFVTSIPSSVDLHVYTTVKRFEPNGKVTIGWIGNPGNFFNLNHILPALRSICSTHNATIKIISSKPPKFDGLPVAFEPWSTRTEVEELLGIDIGIMPLDDDERSRGRCGFKAIQYMALGIPVVATSLGAGAEVVEDGITGFHATTVEEWACRLHTLIDDPKLRETMGIKGRQRAEALYSVQSNLPRLVEVFEKRMSF